MGRWMESREIDERIVITGSLELQTPAHLGGGDSDGLQDMTLLRDASEGRALLTGSSIAGALRNHLCERAFGYGEKEEKGVISMLFGSMKRDDKGDQSLLMVEDSLGEAPQTEIRDGVKIHPVHRTAEDKKKYDIEVLQAGTVFPLRIELLICKKDSSNLKSMKAALAAALDGLEEGQISLGARKRRGYGRCSVKEWKVERYDFRKPADLLAWLNCAAPSDVQEGSSIMELLHADGNYEDKRASFRIEATFGLEGSFLIRSGTGPDPEKPLPDSVHLHSKRNGKHEPVIPGTSLGGVIRHRAEKIANTLCGDEAKVHDLMTEMFGSDMEEKSRTEPNPKKSSRVIVHESTIQGSKSLVVSRIKVDRFTGGAFQSALFNEQPVFGGTVNVNLELRFADPKQIGLLLLVLKDLWTGDLPVGGESSVGRGRLKGKEATLKETGTPPKEWKIVDEKEKLDISGSPVGELQTRYVDELLRYLGVEVES